MGLGAGGSNGQRNGAVFYRFTDASGTVHIVDSVDRIPASQREKAERVEYDDSTNGTSAPPYQSTSPVQHHAAGPSGWQMFSLGVAAALLAALLFRALPGARGTVLRLVLVLALVALLGGAYLGWTRRVAQQSNDLLGSPGAMIEDAKSAVAKMNARVKEQQAQLKEAEQTK